MNPGEDQSTSDHGRRNRIIALVAGAITVVAVVLSFASGYLGQQWQWLRPAGELLLLAELVGLIVLERHQLFEPVHEKVSRIESTLAKLAEGLATSGQVAVCTSPPEVFRAFTLISREALTRAQEGPQILRIASLSGRVFARDSREATRELDEFLDTTTRFLVVANTPSDALSRRWSIRLLVAVATRADLESTMAILAPNVEAKVLNAEIKVFVRPRIENVLSPQLTTDRDCVLALDDSTAALRWGFLCRGRQYAALCARWFDDVWATTSDAYLVYTRSGLNEKALNQIRGELDAAEGARDRATA